MKKNLILGLCAFTAMAQATNLYVSPTGDNSNNGQSWANAKQTIASALSAASAGDTVKVAEGVYNETIVIKDGVSVFGSYSPTLGIRSLDATPTIIDGTGLNKFLLVKYDTPCTNLTTFDGLIFQNAESSVEGGAGFIRKNCVVNNCIVRNCTTSSSGGAFMNEGGTISNTIMELCQAGSSGGAVYNKGGVIFNCIVRGCGGKYGAIRNKSNGIVYNCILYNNAANVDGWPNSGGIYNEAGNVYNCTVANNWGTGESYAGCHSIGVMYNCLLWNNDNDGYKSPACFISTDAHTAGAGDNAADAFFEAANFTYTLSTNNMDATGPHFAAPTTFTGLPKNEAQIAAMRAADFSLLATSPVLNIGRTTGAPATDINGVARPKGTGVDLGAYEYDPDAPTIPVTGIMLNMDTMFVENEKTSAFTTIFIPSNATNRKVTWWIEDPAIATIDSLGVVTAVAEGQTRAAVITADGGHTDTAVVVVTPKVIIIIHPEVLRYDTLYPISNYTVPSFVPFWVAKEAARRDSSEANLQAMRDMVPTLVSKEYPYCLIANINGDPKTCMAFNWLTNEGITNGEVQLVAKADATADDFKGAGVITLPALSVTSKALRYAVSTSGILKATGMDSKTAYKYESHKAIATSLTPGTTYCYRVGYDSIWSHIATFETAKADNQGEYSVLLMSDSHIQDQEYVDNARWCAEAAVKNVPEAKFVLFPGDAEETGTEANSEWEWERWFEESMRPALYKMPFVVTDGNHEDTPNGNWDIHYNTDTLFNVSSVVKPQFKGITYSFVYGDVLFLVFSMQDYWRGSYSESKETSVYLTRDVGNWFRQQVAAHPECKYRVSVCHKNVFSGSGHQEDTETPIFRATMLPIFKDCEIDLALQGHDHCYEVMGPVDPDTRTAITSAIADVQKVTVNTNTNMTGLSGGTFTVDDGTLYFIGATCGRKRYYPYTRAKMDDNISKHKVTNYFDLFTSKFGQPGAPTYTKLTVKSDGLYLDSYQVNDDKGNVSLYNSIKVVRTKEHGLPSGFEQVKAVEVPNSGKFIHGGQLYIIRDGMFYNAQGQRLK